MRALRLLPPFAFSLACALAGEEKEMSSSLVSSLDLKEGAPLLPSLTSLVTTPWEAYISSLADLEQGTSELLKQGVSPECGAACSVGLLGLAGATIYSLYSRCSWKDPPNYVLCRGLDRAGVNRRLGVQRRMSVAESLFQSKDCERDICSFSMSFQEWPKGSSVCRRGIIKGVKLQETRWFNGRMHSGQG